MITAEHITEFTKWLDLTEDVVCTLSGSGVGYGKGSMSCGTVREHTLEQEGYGQGYPAGDSGKFIQLYNPYTAEYILSLLKGG